MCVHQVTLRVQPRGTIVTILQSGSTLMNGLTLSSQPKLNAPEWFGIESWTVNNKPITYLIFTWESTVFCATVTMTLPFFYCSHTFSPLPFFSVYDMGA